MANSLVGVTISTRVTRLRDGRYKSRSRIGKKNAAVLPGSRGRKKNWEEMGGRKVKRIELVLVQATIIKKKVVGTILLPLQCSQATKVRSHVPIYIRTHKYISLLRPNSVLLALLTYQIILYTT